MQYLRQNTAVIVTVGPFYDKTDGVTIETGLTITNERITLSADTDDGSAPTNILDNVTGATSGTSNDLNYISGNDAGMMQLELSAANTNRVGRMLLSITDAANHVPVFHEYFVLPQAIYDWITGVIVPLPANVTTIAGSAVSTSTAQLGVNLVNIAGSAVSTSTAQLGVNAVQAGGTAWGSGAITANSVATGAITNAKFAAGAIDATAIANGAIDAATFAAGAIDAAAIAANAIDADSLASDAGTELGTAVWATAARTLTAATNVTSTGAAVPITAGGLVSADVTAISTDTGAANNAESFFDGTGYAGTNNVIPTVTTVTNQLTAAQIATGVWQDSTAGDFTTASSIGKSLYINNVAPGASGGHMISGTNAGTTVLGALTVTGATTLTGAVTGTNVSNDLRGISVNMIKDQAITCTSGVTILASVGTAATSTAQTGDTYALANGANGFANIKSDTAAILSDTGTDGVVVAAASKTGYALTDAGVDAIWDRASSLTVSFETLLTRAYQMINNKMNVTDADGTVALRAIGDGSTIATGSVTDNSTTTTRLELTWA